MDLSLVVCTRNRCRQLARCLESVECIIFPRPWELIVVDNGSSDDTAAAVREFAARARFPVRYVFEPKPGLGNARNSGVAMAGGAIVAFTDDDCYPASDFLARIWPAFADQSVGYITGRILLHDPTDEPMTIRLSTTPLTFPAKSFVNAGTISGANIAFRRSVLDEIGGFDPLFGTGSLFSAEDLDAAGRASLLGWRGEYRPEVVVSHHHGRKAADIPRLVKAYGIGIGAYHMKVLLREHQFSWFLQSIYQVRRRLRASVRSVLWEPVGAAMYAYIYVRQGLYRRDRKILTAGLQRNDN